MTRRTVAKGIYQDPFGYEIRWRVAGVPQRKRFPLDTPLATLKSYRARQLGQAEQYAATTKPGSFTRDAVRFLASRKALASFKSDRAHLRVWIARFGRFSRYAITRDMVRTALSDWQLQGYSPRELRHRWRILSQCFTTLDPDGPNPCRGVKLPKIVKSRPRSVSDAVVRDVALQLRKAEIAGLLRDAKTRARYLVLATTGQRPAQLKRAKPADVDLERRLWFVDPAKGDNGTIVYLNDDMRAAWGLFIAAQAWGAYDGRSFAKTLRWNGWPTGIRPYNLRHSVGLSLSELGVDLGDIQHAMGHTSPNTTRIYVPGVLARLKAASGKLDGRLTHGPDTNQTGGKDTLRENRPLFAPPTVPMKTRLRRDRRQKQA